jgi:hypothetical protein
MNAAFAFRRPPLEGEGKVAGTPAHLSYAPRILEGPAYTVAQALASAGR